MPNLNSALAPSFSVTAIHRAFAVLLVLLLLSPVAAHAQDDSGGQDNPSGQQQDPDDPDDPDDGGPNDPGEEEFEPVILATSVSPARVPITSGTATLTWSSSGARYCPV